MPIIIQQIATIPIQFIYGQELLVIHVAKRCIITTIYEAVKSVSLTISRIINRLSIARRQHHGHYMKVKTYLPVQRGGSFQ